MFTPDSVLDPTQVLAGADCSPHCGPLAGHLLEHAAAHATWWSTLPSQLFYPALLALTLGSVLLVEGAIHRHYVNKER